MSTGLNIAIAAEFELCEKLTETLEQSDLPIEKISIVDIYPFGDEQNIRFNGKSIENIETDKVEWSDFNYLLFAGNLQHGPLLAQASQQDCVVIDLKGVCTALSDVPMVVPQVNEIELVNLRQRNIVSLPDPQITQLALAISSFVNEVTQPQIALTTLLPASYQNSEIVSKLAGQTAQLLNGIPLDEDQQRLAFDVFPASTPNIVMQIQRIFPQIQRIAATHQIQAPVFYGIGQMVTLTGDYELDLENLTSDWQQNEWIDYQADKLITPVTNGEQETGEAPKLHISQVVTVENGVQFWSVADDQRFNIALMGKKLLEAVYYNGY